jgi:hypothetical protein
VALPKTDATSRLDLQKIAYFLNISDFSSSSSILRTEL